MKIFLRYLTLAFLLAFLPYNFLHAMDAECPHCDQLRDECFMVKATVKARGGGATGKWIDNVTPKRGWKCVGAEDLGAGNSLQCEMCEREQPRYIHYMEHGTSPQLKVGCHCAAYMEGRLDDASYLQGRLTAAKNRQNRLVRRENFPTLQKPKWKTSKSGNPYINYLNNNIVIFPNKKRPGKYSASINRAIIPGSYGSVLEAKLAAFDRVDPLEAN